MKFHLLSTWITCAIFIENKLCQNSKTQNRTLRHRTFRSVIKKLRVGAEARYICQVSGSLSQRLCNLAKQTQGRPPKIENGRPCRAV